MRYGNDVTTFGIGGGQQAGRDDGDNVEQIVNNIY